MQWNCNSLPAHDFSRIPLIEAYSSMHKLKLIALSETALKVNHKDELLKIEGFSLIRNDMPEGDTHGGVMIYYKDDLAVKHRTDLQLIPNNIVIELSINRKKVIFILAYRNVANLMTKGFYLNKKLTKF